MNGKSKERLHLFQKMEKELREMNQEEVVDCSEATLQSMKRIFKELRLAIFGVEVGKIKDLRAAGKLSAKKAIHRIALLRKKYF